MVWSPLRATSRRPPSADPPCDPRAPRETLAIPVTIDDRETVAFDPRFKVGEIVVSFSDRRLYHVQKSGTALSYPFAVPRELERWILRCLDKDPDARISFKELRTHKAFEAFIPKSAAPEEIGAALQAVFACQVWVPRTLAGRGASESQIDKDLSRRLGSLTPQQYRVLELVAQGKLNKQIADALGIQERTVKAHLQAIFEKLGARNRTQAGVFLRQLELTDPARQVEAV